MEHSLGYLVSVADVVVSGSTLLISCVLHLCFLLGKVDTRVVVLLHLLEEVESRNDDLLAVERNSQWVSTKSDLLDPILVGTDETAHDVL